MHFLHGDLNEEVYMQLPLGYPVENNSKVCKLLKSLYGLKQASRQWYAKLLDFVIKLSFIQSKDDYSLFIKTKDGIFTAVLIYVDDVIIISNSLDFAKQLKSLLNEKFKIKDLGDLKFFIRIEVTLSEKVIYNVSENMLWTCLQILEQVVQLLSNCHLIKILNYQKKMANFFHMHHFIEDLLEGLCI